MESMISNNPLVSVLVPIFQVAPYIERCARSLFEQTYKNIEYVFVDDCSPDDSVAILLNVLKEYPERRNNVHIIHQTQNRGLSAVRNTAVANATGEFLMHVDSDDWMEVDAVEKLMARQLLTGADIVSGNFVIHTNDKEEIIEEPDYSNKEEFLHRMVRLTLDHTLWRRIIRRELYLKNDIFTIEGVNTSEDMQAMAKLVYYADSYAKLDACVYHYDCRTYSITRLKGRKFNLRKYLDDIKSIDILTDFFEGKDASCIDILVEEKKQYQELAMNSAVRFYDYRAYKEIAKDMMLSSLSYWPLLVSVLFCKAVRKITGIKIGPLKK